MVEMAGKKISGRISFIICFSLVLLVWGVFGQTIRYGFVNYDDNKDVYENAAVVQGLTGKGVVHAFTSGQAGVYYPLTVLSFMADVELYGLDAGGFHLTNVLLHAATVVLLFLVLLQMTGSLWRSAFVAAVFAIHPLRAESVAWVTERKDVLSGFFFMLTLGAYGFYVRRPFLLHLYMAVLAFFTLGLLSKPMLVTLPFVLWLLDGWPLGRFPKGPAAVAVPPYPASMRRVILEKIPLLLVAVLVSAFTVLSHAQTEPWTFAWPWRLGNAAVSYVAYIGQTLWPLDLAVHYPHPGSSLPIWKIAFALVALAGISLVVYRGRQTRPYLLVGWLWYVGMLVPVIGIVRTLGGAARADRFTYLPQIGLVAMAVWLVADGCKTLRYRRALLAMASVAVLAVLAAAAHRQTQNWRDSIALWTHTLATTPDNALAHYNLGCALIAQQRVEEAISHFEKALEIDPGHIEAYNNLGSLLVRQERFEQAVPQFEQVLSTNPDSADAHNNLGSALGGLGRYDKAVPHFEKAIAINPGFIEAYNNLGGVFARQGRLEQAVEQFGKALAINPDYADAHKNLVGVFLNQGQFGMAIGHMENILRITPDSIEAKNNLAWILATCPNPLFRDGKRAVELARSADQLAGGKSASILDTLAAAYAEAGQYPQAVATVRRALAAPAGQKSVADGLRARLQLYEAGIPYHESRVNR